MDDDDTRGDSPPDHHDDGLDDEEYDDVSKWDLSISISSIRFFVFFFGGGRGHSCFNRLYDTTNLKGTFSQVELLTRLSSGSTLCAPLFPTPLPAIHVQILLPFMPFICIGVGRVGVGVLDTFSLRAVKHADPKVDARMDSHYQDEHGDMDPMSPDGMGEAMGQRDHDFGDPEYGTGEPTGGDGDGDGDGGDMNDTGGEYDGMSPDGGDGAATDTDDDDEEGMKVEGAYDPADYQGLAVSSDIKELFTYITRYTPVSQELDTKLKPFIPDFIPAVGDIDAMIKIGRVDGQDQGLGLAVLDEPCAAQSDPTVLDLQLRAISKTTTTKAVAVKQVGGGGAAAGKAIDSWINSITELHREKPPQSVNYSTVMPEIETLMQEWPTEFEELLTSVRLPTADLNCTLKEYVHIVCAICDIPIHKSRVESLHLLFTLFSEFKNSQHFRSADEIAEAEVGAAVEPDAPEGVQGDIMTFD